MTSITARSPALNPCTSGPDDEHMPNRAPAPETHDPNGTARVYFQRRSHPRVRVAGQVRLVADSVNGLVTLTGNVIDLSVSGCAIRVHTPLENNREARIELSVDRERIWVPGQVVWTRVKDRGWVVGIRFDRLVPKKQSLITRLVARRRELAD